MRKLVLRVRQQTVDRMEQHDGRIRTAHVHSQQAVGGKIIVLMSCRCLRDGSICQICFEAEARSPPVHV